MFTFQIFVYIANHFTFFWLYGSRKIATQENMGFGMLFQVRGPTKKKFS